MRTKMVRQTVFIMILAIFFSGILFSQAGRGKARLKGFLYDENKKPAPGVDIQLVFTQNRGHILKSQTNKKGAWVFTNLGSGNWEVIVRQPGYEPIEKKVMVSQINLNPSVKIFLKKTAKTIATENLRADATMIQQGEMLYKAKKYTEALKIFQTYLEKQPDVYQTYFYIGDCYRDMGELDKALEIYNTLKTKIPAGETSKKELSRILAAIGDIYIKKDDLTNAQAFFKESLMVDPSDEILAYNVAEIYFSNNKSNEAIEYYTLCTKIKPKWADPYLKLGYTYTNLADYKSAIKSFNEFLKIDPQHPQAETVKAIVQSLNQQ